MSFHSPRMLESAHVNQDQPCGPVSLQFYWFQLRFHVLQLRNPKCVRLLCPRAAALDSSEQSLVAWKHEATCFLRFGPLAFPLYHLLKCTGQTPDVFSCQSRTLKIDMLTLDVIRKQWAEQKRQ